MSEFVYFYQIIKLTTMFAKLYYFIKDGISLKSVHTYQEKNVQIIS